MLELYQQAPERGDTLAVTVESDLAMGEKELAQDIRRVLELNHPDHPHLHGASMVGGKPFWRRTIRFG